jgi:hypothetical protein
MISGALGGLVLTPALYKWTSAVTINAAGVTFTGTSADGMSPSSTRLSLLTLSKKVFVFQIAGTLNFAAGAKVTLVGGVLASNIFWVVAGSVTAAPGAHIEGVILGKTAVTLQTGTTMNGRILSQTFVALQSVSFSLPLHDLGALVHDTASRRQSLDR